MNDNFVCLGKIINVRGLKGELKLFSFTDFPKERFKKGNKIYFSKEDKLEEFTVSSFSVVSNFVYLKVDEIVDVEKANLYRDFEVLFKKEFIKNTKDNCYFYSDLIGSKVYIENEFVGNVKSVENNGANYNIRIETNNKELLFPFIKSFLLEVNINDKIIRYQNIEGLK